MSFSWSLFVYRACDVSLNLGKTYPLKAILWCFHCILEIRFVLLFVMLTLLFHVAFYSSPFMPWIYTRWPSCLSDIQHSNYWLLRFLARVLRKLKSLHLSTFREIEVLLHHSEENLAEMSSGVWLSSRILKSSAISQHISHVVALSLMRLRLLRAILECLLTLQPKLQQMKCEHAFIASSRKFFCCSTSFYVLFDVIYVTPLRFMCYFV